MSLEILDKRVKSPILSHPFLSFLFAFTLLVGLFALPSQSTNAQTKTLTYPAIITALNTKIPNRSFKDKAQLIDFLIKKVGERKVDKPLTKGIEELLRQAGATDELIEVIKANSLARVTGQDRRDIRVLKAGVVLETSMGMDLVYIPSGSFVMGSPLSESKRSENEGPQRRVIIGNAFWIGKYEVTQEEYVKVMRTNPSKFRNCQRCPVENVSWNNAKEFVRKLNASNDGYEYRLPTEAEWEYAARAGTRTEFAFGDSLSSRQANFHGKYPYGSRSIGEWKMRTVTVGSYQPNAWGLYDMHGNVWEWVEDIYNSSYKGLPADGSANKSSGDSGAMVLRGGSWADAGLSVRSSYRNWLRPTGRSNGADGFRVVAHLK